MDDPIDIQAKFAFQTLANAGIFNTQLFNAFATVRREAFLGPPPWYKWRAPEPDETADGADVELSGDGLAFVYDDTLIAIDRSKGINNGTPSLHAICMHALGVGDGHTVLHIGAGTGYYSAILAKLVGPTGHVFAYEIDQRLAGLAKINLIDFLNVEVQAVSGTSGELPSADLIYVSAGSTHPCKTWLEALRPGGRLLFPLQPASGFSGVLLVTKPVGKNNPISRFIKSDKSWKARFVIRANFIHCEDVPPETDKAAELAAGFADERWTFVKKLHFNDHTDHRCWFKGDGWWLST